MSTDECIEEYEQLGGRIFGHPRRFHRRNTRIVPREKYDHLELEKAIKDIVKKRSPLQDHGTMFRQPDDMMCRTQVATLSSKYSLTDC